MTKGFADIQKPLLVKGWLLPENRKHYRFKDNAFVLESLGMTLNMWVAIASERLKKLSSLDTTQDAVFALIVELDTELMEKPPLEAGKWLHSLRHSDKYYIDYIRRLEALVKQKIEAGEYSQLNGMIQNSWEYKQWMQEAGYLQVGINLIDGIYHPLTEVTNINGEDCMNFWGVASMMAGVATRRDNDGNPEKVITTLIQMGVLDMEKDYKTRFLMCRHMDAEYIKLIGEIKEALDKSVKAA